MRNADFLDGLKASPPIMLAMTPFGVLFGALAVDNGLSVSETVLMSAALFAGASQMVGIELFGQDVAPWLIVLSIFAVNFRMVLYSAAIARHLTGWSQARKLVALFLLTDVQFVESERRSETGRKLSFAWYLGLGLALYLTWVVEAWIGAMFGNLIPDPYAFGFDFLVSLYFFGLVLSFRRRAYWLPVVVGSAIASIVAFRIVGTPWHVAIGAMAGVAMAASLPPRAKHPGRDADV